MKYMQIGLGSRGEDVKTLQEELNGSGYKLDVDGNFGHKTQAAVKDYQKKNNLTVDGVVGKNTWGSLTGFKPEDKMAVSTMGATEAQTQAPVADTGYVESENVRNAQALLDAYQQNKPGDFSFGKQDQLDAIMDQILNRDKFSYDLNGDALYKQYAQQYAQQGKMAMMDTMGQAAALTGGYGSSYGQSVGQQAYQGYLQQLNDVVPELYGMALDQYNQEGERMLKQYGFLSGERDQEYGKHRDQVADYYTELQRLTDEARYVSEDEYGKWIDERNYEYQKGRDAVEDEQWERSFKYQQERDSVQDKQWAQEFEEAQRQYNESKKSSSGGSTESYEMSTDDWDYWNNQWSMVETDADAEALAESMEAAGVPFDLIAIWYKKYTGGYEKDEEPQNTDLDDLKGKRYNTGGGGGGKFGAHYVYN